MSVTVAAMCRNEATRYLPSALDAWRAFADEIVVLDDGSEDATADLAQAAGVRLVRREHDGGAGWGREWEKRDALWRAATSLGTSWVFVLDADMVPAGDPTALWRDLPESVEAAAFRLYDLWTLGELPFYREDELWCAHKWPRVWAVRPAALKEAPRWNERGVHCGHFPSNFRAKITAIAPVEMSILHYGYADRRDRQTKLAQYLSIGQQLTPAELEHAKTIVDEAHVRPLPMTPRWPLTRAS